MDSCFPLQSARDVSTLWWIPLSGKASKRQSLKYSARQCSGFLVTQCLQTALYQATLWLIHCPLGQQNCTKHPIHPSSQKSEQTVRWNSSIMGLNSKFRSKSIQICLQPKYLLKNYFSAFRFRKQKRRKILNPSTTASRFLQLLQLAPQRRASKMQQLTYVHWI